MPTNYGYVIFADVSKEIREMTIEEEPEQTSGGNSDNDSQSGILYGCSVYGVYICFVIQTMRLLMNQK
jgi:hypothetical protein